MISNQIYHVFHRHAREIVFALFFPLGFFSSVLYVFVFVFFIRLFCLHCKVINNISMFAMFPSAGMTEEITGDWSYYVYISLTLVPVYLAFRLIKSLGWQLFVNNWANIWTRNCSSSWSWSWSNIYLWHKLKLKLQPSSGESVVAEKRKKTSAAKVDEVRSHLRLPVRSGRVPKVECR